MLIKSRSGSLKILVHQHSSIQILKYQQLIINSTYKFRCPPMEWLIFVLKSKNVEEQKILNLFLYWNRKTSSVKFKFFCSSTFFDFNTKISHSMGGHVPWNDLFLMIYYFKSCTKYTYRTDVTMYDRLGISVVILLKYRISE